MTIFISWTVSIVAVALFRTTIQQFIHIQISTLEFLKVSGLLFLFVLLAGFGIVMIASSKVFQVSAANAIKGRVILSTGFSSWMKHGFVFVQFTIALFTGICSLVILQQITMLKQKDLGYSFVGAWSVQRPENVSVEKWTTFRSKLEENSNVMATGQSVYPAIGDYNNVLIKDAKSNEEFEVSWLGIDEKYIPTMGMKLVAGRNFTDRESDKAALIVNRTAARLLGGDSLVAKEFLFPFTPGGQGAGSWCGGRFSIQLRKGTNAAGSDDDWRSYGHEKYGVPDEQPPYRTRSYRDHQSKLQRGKHRWRTEDLRYGELI